MSNTEVLIRAEDVGKKFCRDLKKSLWYGVKDSVADLMRWRDTSRPTSELRIGEFWANRDISFEVRRGDCLGLIGRNGAGKTTLLKILSGLIKPDHGCVEVCGHVGGLIALGAGFNPVLTGRENIAVNGSILGLSRKHIKDRLEKIIDFAEIADAIDAPLMTYSSGMQVRLGFAIAVCLIEPDVLFLDEVLAVGDVAFRAKCYNEVARLKSQTATVFVSHQMSMIATTSNCGLVLDRGRQVCTGSPSEIIETYNSLNRNRNSTGHRLLHDQIQQAEFELSTNHVDFGSGLTISGIVDSQSDFSESYFDIVFYAATGEVVAQWNGLQNRRIFSIVVGRNQVECEIESVSLAAGTYPLGIVIRCSQTSAVLAWSYKELHIETRDSNAGVCAYQMR